MTSADDFGPIKDAVVNIFEKYTKICFKVSTISRRHWGTVEFRNPFFALVSK